MWDLSALGSQLLTAVSFEMIVLIIFPLFSHLLINFADYVNVFWWPKLLHNDQSYISFLDFSCYMFSLAC